MRLSARLDEARSSTVVLGAVALILLVGVVDYVTGYQFGCSIFYLVPVILAAWRAGRGAGLAAAAVAAATWLVVDLYWAERYAHHLLPYWNAGVRFAFFSIVTLLLTALRNERELVRTDFLTHLWNRRGFVDALSREIELCRRHNRPFAIAFIDCDDFKRVNDAGGHAAGDSLLVGVGRTLRSRTRATDTAARIGGDEFAMILTDVVPESASAAVAKLREALLDCMRQGGWPVTFSIGLVTFVAAPASPDEALRRADLAMYAAKRAGKNVVVQTTCGGP